jgi:hypothetical protein
MGNRKALLVGVNNFQFLNSPLKGCVNDTLDMAALLKDTLGFTDGDITLLHDAQATKSNVMAALTGFVESAKRGETKYIVFQFSSHGTQIPDVGGDESDQADEAFCPYDLKQKGDQWDPAHIISDDELHDLFGQLPPTVLLECYFDTCHSGTGLKPVDLMGFDDVPKARYVPPPSFAAFKRLRKLPTRGLAELRVGKRSVVAPKKDGTLKNLDASSREAVNTSKFHILWAGCRPDQTSADATFNGRSNGAFTYHYVKAVRENKNKASRRKILLAVRNALKKGGFSQIVQLEADATNRNGRAPEA